MLLPVVLPERLVSAGGVVAARSVADKRKGPMAILTLPVMLLKSAFLSPAACLPPWCCLRAPESAGGGRCPGVARSALSPIAVFWLPMVLLEERPESAGGGVVVARCVAKERRVRGVLRCLLCC